MNTWPLSLLAWYRYFIVSFLCNVLWIVICPFVIFLFAIVLSFLLRFTDSNYSFAIFKLFLSPICLSKYLYQASKLSGHASDFHMRIKYLSANYLLEISAYKIEHFLNSRWNWPIHTFVFKYIKIIWHYQRNI
jgi:hypothetical protein